MPAIGMSSERGDRADSFAHKIRAQFWDRMTMLVFLMAYASHCECASGCKLRAGGDRARKVAQRWQDAGAVEHQIRAQFQYQKVGTFCIKAYASHCIFWGFLRFSMFS